MVFRILVIVALLGVACATAPELSDPNGSGIWGFVRLVPREGVETASSGGGAYGDRRLGDAQRVDYSRPGFVVVYVEDETPPPPGTLSLAIRSGDVRPRVEPSFAAARIGDRIRLTNESEVDRVVSCPAARIVRGLAPGDSIEVQAGASGELAFFLLGESVIESRVFVSPGVYSVVSDSGRFELTDLQPGMTRLHAWHPRLPPTFQEVELSAGEILRLDVEMGVGTLSEGSGDAH